jgi:hypothetical protein
MEILMSDMSCLLKQGAKPFTDYDFRAFPGAEIVERAYLRPFPRAETESGYGNGNNLDGVQAN